MRILAGYLPATSAEVLEVAGHDVLRASLEVRKRIGYLPEAVPLYRELRVEEMLRFHGRLHGMDGARLRSRMGEVLDRVGLTDRSRQLVGNLSRGLRQRVGLAVALLPGPEVLILDEPTSGLDPLQRREVRDLVRELGAEHTVLVSSHILAEIEAMCPRVLVLTGGRLVADGSREELESRLGGRGAVRVEAVVGPDPEAARALMESLPGVARVELGERLGIHYTFHVHGEGDLREDVGALAATQGWALRELSFQSRSLEELFAHLVAGGDAQELEAEETASPSGAAPATAVQPDPAGASLTLELPQAPAASAEAPSQRAGDAPSPAPQPATGKRVIYSLNPFDRGAQRDLGAPVEVDDAPAPSIDEAGLTPPRPDGEEESA
jgi:ABC-2 type transport system ATP-binding protein